MTTGLPDLETLLHTLLLLVVAVICGGMIGWNREVAGKAAGLRTHMLVSLGTAFFVVASVESGLTPEGVSRVIQGLATGIGFLGAGAILKGNDENEIRGLTTAASIWMAAAIGAAVGLGRVWLAFAGALFTLLILSVMQRLERRIDVKRPPQQ